MQAGTDALLRSVHHVAEELGHQPVTGVDGASVTFRSSTSSVGRISDLDVDVAARIDQVLSGSEATGTDPARS